MVAWVRGLLDELVALPPTDPRRATEEEIAAVEAGLDRIGEAAAALAGSGLPDSLQHNDLHLGNALRAPAGGYAVIDLGDALWTHPLTTSRIPRWVLRYRLGHEPGSPELV
ncbi:MAG TPA: phosphotransferase, partial [Phycicoccus sp.]|nr:phosphotransferase [Phycicoccus sp.]